MNGGQTTEKKSGEVLFQYHIMRNAKKIIYKFQDQHANSKQTKPTSLLLANFSVNLKREHYYLESK